ncbi:hypothetical protein J4558_01645 [Leptolyngbya sp. 15MV]|nr:hypothetical protein J4558_01645 [Leptolyngbya sp. 15MV]
MALRTVLLSLLALIALVSALAVAQAQSGSALRYQVVDERGVPVRDAVVEVRPAAVVAEEGEKTWNSGISL